MGPRELESLTKKVISVRKLDWVVVLSFIYITLVAKSTLLDVYNNFLRGRKYALPELVVSLPLGQSKFLRFKKIIC